MTFVNESVAGKLGKEDNLARAKGMLADGHAPTDVFNETGWGLTPYGQLETALDDRDFALTGNLGEDPIRFDEAVTHPTLFDAVPEMRDVTIQQAPAGSEVAETPGFLGYYDPVNDHIVVKDANDIESIAHEGLGHGVQDQLMFPEEGHGTSPEAAGSFEAYEEWPGEVAARDIAESLDAGPDEVPDLVIRAENEGVSAPAAG